MKDGVEMTTSLILGTANTIMATNVNDVSSIVSLIAAICSFGFTAFKIVQIAIKHFKEKHKENCDCIKQLDVLLGRDKEDGE